MTPIQQNNVLSWVEALLSGNYNHGRHLLYNPTNGRYSAAGVALEIAGYEYDENKAFMLPIDFPAGDTDVKGLFLTSVPQKWFAQEFGLPHSAGLYQTINDVSKDYLPVVALLLNAVPNTSRRAYLHKVFMEQTGRQR